MSRDVVSTDLVPAIGPLDGAASPSARAADQASLLDRVAVFTLGFSLQFNVITATFGLPFLRLSDLVPFAVIPYLCLRTDFVSRALRNALRIGIVLILLGASVMLKAEKAQGDVYMTLILMVYVVQALQILMVFGDRLLTTLCVGMLVGYVGSLAVLIAAGEGIELEAYGLAVSIEDPTPVSAEIARFMQDKLGGLWAAGNQTGHIYAAAGAVALYLTMRLRSKLIYIAYFVGLLVSFPLTSNRAGLIAPALGLLFVVRRGFKLWHCLLLASVVAVVALYSGVTGRYPISDSLSSALESRLYADSNLDNNFSERLSSGFEAVRLMVANPFGIGVAAMENELTILTGVPTPHNGIISLGLQSGILVTLLYVLSLVQILIGRSRVYGRFVYLTVLFSTPSMFFEQLTATQYFLFIIAIVLAAWVVRGDGRQAGLSASGRAAGVDAAAFGARVASR